jgi:hypothetical protein
MKREQAKKRDTVDYETKEESIIFSKLVIVMAIIRFKFKINI